MNDRTPSGTRDVLPDEMRELRAVTERIRGVFEAAGYGEVYTPALEYERTFERGASGPSAVYRLFDEHGQVLVLRLGHDGPDRASRRDALRVGAGRRCASPTSRTPTGPSSRSAVRRASSCRPESS